VKGGGRAVRKGDKTSRSRHVLRPGIKIIVRLSGGDKGPGTSSGRHEKPGVSLDGDRNRARDTDEKHVFLVGK